MLKTGLISVTLISTMAAAQLPRTEEMAKQPSVRGSWGLVSVDAEGAWSLTGHDAEVIVAVIDTGADTEHPDLRSALWTNPGETGLVDHPKCKDVTSHFATKREMVSMMTKTVSSMTCTDGTLRPTTII